MYLDYNFMLVNMEDPPLQILTKKSLLNYIA